MTNIFFQIYYQEFSPPAKTGISPPTLGPIQIFMRLRYDPGDTTQLKSQKYVFFYRHGDPTGAFSNLFSGHDLSRVLENA